MNVDENDNIAKHKNDLDRPRIPINFIVDLLINHEEKFSDDEIRTHLLTMQITASDTTTNLVASCIMFMAIHQDVQQKVFDEIVDIFRGNFEIDYERLNELRYLEMVLKETLRLFSPLPSMVRETIDDCDLGTGKTVRKDTKIMILSYVLHQRRDIWGREAYKFDPENFSPENVSKRDPYSFIPFGSVSQLRHATIISQNSHLQGVRNCIGQRYSMIASKVFIVEMLRAFKFNTKLTDKDMKMRLAFTGKLASEHLVTIEERN